LEFERLVIPAAILVALTSLFQPIARKWWINLGLLAIQYAGVFMLLGLEWPLSMAMTTLIAGWMACVVLAMVILGMPTTSAADTLFYDPQRNVSPIFYLMTAIFMGIIVSSATPFVSQWIPGIQFYQTWSGLILIGFGFLRIGFSYYPLPICIGILTLLSGFEILYASMDGSLFVAGSLAAVSLGLALAGAYLQVVPTMEENR